jgi:hypothetical protein
MRSAATPPDPIDSGVELIMKEYFKVAFDTLVIIRKDNIKSQFEWLFEALGGQAGADQDIWKFNLVLLFRWNNWDETHCNLVAAGPSPKKSNSTPTQLRGDNEGPPSNYDDNEWIDSADLPMQLDDLNEGYSNKPADEYKDDENSIVSKSKRTLLMASQTNSPFLVSLSPYLLLYRLCRGMFRLTVLMPRLQ